MQSTLHKVHAMSRRILLKFGGNALSDKEDMNRFAQDVHTISESSFTPVIVHGGGPEISAEMEKRGMKALKVAGLRVTDLKALQVAEEVLKLLNSDIVQVFQKAGCSIQGMSAEGIIIATKKPPVLSDGSEVDLGYVGDVASVNSQKLESVLLSGKIPVIYPICTDSSGVKLNVNADTVASGVAKAAGASEMVLVTDVPGILNDGKRIPSLTLAEVDKLIDSKVITGGMLPKVEACRTALLNGVDTVYMLNGKEPHSLARRLLDGEDCGTSITVE